MPQTFYSEEEYGEIRRINSCFVEQLQNVAERAASKSLSSEERDEWQKKGRFDFIPNYSLNLINILRELYKINDKALGTYPPDTRTFCDAGSGIGIPSFLFKVFFPYTFCTGVELNKNVAGKDIFNDVVINDDILKFEGYGKFDVIYYYSPLRDDVLERVFEKRVEDQCKVGCVLICCRKRNDATFKDSRFRQVRSEVLKNNGCDVFVKVSNKKRKTRRTE